MSNNLYYLIASFIFINLTIIIVCFMFFKCKHNNNEVLYKGAEYQIGLSREMPHHYYYAMKCDDCGKIYKEEL